MDYYAHSRYALSGELEYQLLKDHLVEVAELSASYAEAFKSEYLGYLAGILHDAGKYSLDFQDRIRGSARRVDHATAGAQWIKKKENYSKYLGKTLLDQRLARLIAQVIAGHHGGLRDYGTLDEEGSFKCRIAKDGSKVPDWSVAWTELEVKQDSSLQKGYSIFKAPHVTNSNIAWKYSFLGRMIYSCLVDADSINTRNYCNDDDRRIIEEHRQPTIDELLDRLEAYMAPFKQAKDTRINRRRKQILNACQRQADLSPGLFSLSVPTGGGKTLSSLSFALRHAQKNKLRRIIYVIPFTSIIDQNAAKFREALGDEAVLEHHSNFNSEEYEEHHGEEEGRRLKLSTENWDAPVIVTTSVQFFESLFSNKRSKLRKLHNLANAVIVVDEVQSLPRGYVSPSIQALQELIQSYGCSVVLCTATQPSWPKLGVQPIEIMNDPPPNELVEAFKRVDISIHGDAANVIADSVVTDWAAENKQVLCIVNTRKHARILYELWVEQELEGIYHLSGRMCAKHRQDVLGEVRERLMNKQPCRVISTQLIEAGVDVDFPLVFRALAGLDSIAQAAGRCNREGMLACGEVRVFYPEKHGMPSKGWLKETAIEAQHLLNTPNADPLSLETMRCYFDRIYGIQDGSINRLEHEAVITDAKGIIALLASKNANMEIPYEDIANKFQFIEQEMQAIVVPYIPINDDGQQQTVHEILDDLRSGYSGSIQLLRKLQAYTVQVYWHELQAYMQVDLLENVGGVLCLREPAYYDQAAGLKQPQDYVEHEVLIF